MFKIIFVYTESTPSSFVIHDEPLLRPSIWGPSTNCTDAFKEFTEFQLISTSQVVILH